MILACDPGVHACGLAWFNNGVLAAARYVKTEDLFRYVFPGHADCLYLERQYLPKKHPRPMDIVNLSFAAGHVRGLVRDTPVTEYQPMTWKGNVPKPIMMRRILSILSKDEVARIERVGHKDHNTIDAVGIGLFALGRL